MLIIDEMILSETSKIELLNDLISIIGSGTTKYKDIVSKMNQYSNSRPDYLINKLIEMNILKKVTPINHRNNSERMRFDFYYRHLFNSPYSINRRNKEFFFSNFIKEDLESNFIPHKFESISKEFPLKRSFSNKMDPIILNIGSYSYYDAKEKINREFDIVTLDKNGYISYECKCTNETIDNKVIQEEERQTNNLGVKFYKLGFISKRGFSSHVDQSKYNCFTLEDFFDFES